MGLWQFLNRPLFNNPRVLFRWREPGFWAMRMHRDLMPWLAVAPLGAAACVGLLLVIFGLTADAQSRLSWEAIILVAILGGTILFLSIVLRKEDAVQTDVIVSDRDLKRSRHQAAFLDMELETTTWPYEAIDWCMIVPGSAFRQSFSVLLVSSQGRVDTIGIPERVNLDALAEQLRLRQVPVSLADELPSVCAAPRLKYQTLLTATGLVSALLAIGVGLVGPRFGELQIRPPVELPPPMQAAQPWRQPPEGLFPEGLPARNLPQIRPKGVRPPFMPPRRLGNEPWHVKQNQAPPW